ncbi:MAG: DUF4388 domain-containing protein [Pseudomonadota bacterium]
MAPVGGQVQGISLDSFLQMVQMEKTTCTLRVLSEEDVGFIYILKGVLIAAEVGALSGIDAAHEIISWENSVIEIDKACDRTEDQIKQPLMTILMEGLRLRDDRQASGGALRMMDTQSMATPPASPRPTVPQPPAPADATSPVPAPAAEVTHVTASEKPGFEFPQRKKKKKISLLRILLILIIVVAAGAGAYLSVGVSGAEKKYRALQSQLLETPTLMEKVNLLEAFIETGPTGEHAASANRLLLSFKGAMDAEIFAAAIEKASALANKGDLKAAYEVFSQYLEANPKSSVRSHAEKEMAALASQMADIAFNELTKKTQSLGPERLNLYDDFLTSYPSSAHEDAVRALIAEMATEYYGYFETQVAIATHEENWQHCNSLVSQFTRLYPDHPRTPVLSKLIPIFEKNQRQKTDFEQLLVTAREKGTDYIAAGAVLTKYLSAYPDSYLRDRIKAQIERYQRLSEEARIDDLRKTTAETVNAAGKRFKADTIGTILDTRTGLMWTLLDSQALLQDCIDYTGALTFVAGLKTGGHNDWRLPSPEELEGITKETPSLPSTGDAWYWSDKNYRRFVGEWIFRVTVVSTDPLRGPLPLQKDSKDCGNVRAVRRP